MTAMPMAPEAAAALRTLLQRQPIAALGTLHRGEPYVSMAPFALEPVGPALLIHVSGLSPHTRDMREHPRVSLLVVAPDDGGRPQARPRATIQGDASPLDRDSDRYAQARALYLRRFPEAVDTFALADFSLFAIRPVAVRFIGGFAQAVSLTPEVFARALREV
jgi:putative heme iron utilization protein